MRALVVGDKVHMKHHGSQHTDYQQATKTGRIIKVYQFQKQTLARVAWNMGPMSEEFIEDLKFVKEEYHGSSDNQEMCQEF
jgi:hypothetical protein